MTQKKNNHPSPQDHNSEQPFYSIGSKAFELGQEYLQAQNYPAAVFNFKIAARAYKGCKESAQANYNLGVLYEQEPSVRNYDRALQGYGNALSLGFERARGDYMALKAQLLDETVSQDHKSWDAMMDEVRHTADIPAFQQWDCD